MSSMCFYKVGNTSVDICLLMRVLFILFAVVGRGLFFAVCCRGCCFLLDAGLAVSSLLNGLLFPICHRGYRLPCAV